MQKRWPHFGIYFYGCLFFLTHLVYQPCLFPLFRTCGGRLQQYILLVVECIIFIYYCVYILSGGGLLLSLYSVFMVSIL
jgi:hypothetical protein